MAGHGGVSHNALIKAKEAGKDKLNLFEEKAINEQLDKIVPGAPTSGKVIIRIQDDEIAKNTITTLETNTNIHQIVEVGECNDTRLKIGVWIQMQKSSAMEEVEWGTKKMMIVREHQIVFVFKKNPRAEFKKLADKAL